MRVDSRRLRPLEQVENKEKGNSRVWGEGWAEGPSETGKGLHGSWKIPGQSSRSRSTWAKEGLRDSPGHGKEGKGVVLALPRSTDSLPSLSPPPVPKCQS